MITSYRNIGTKSPISYHADNSMTARRPQVCAKKYASDLLLKWMVEKNTVLATY